MMPVMLQSEMERLLSQRDGPVLTKNSILKSEHFPLSHSNSNLPLHIHGAPNFRKTSHNICGVAQPSVSGLCAIHQLLRRNGKPVWMCIRDEPVVYLDGLPYVLRDADDPLQNMRAFSGISAQRVETLEERLVEDILNELKTSNGLTVIHEEQEKGFVQAFFMSPQKIQTSKQVFEELAQKGIDFAYFRIPISHEQSPTESFVDELLLCLDGLGNDNAIVFSGGMGVGRTTFAMAAASIYRNPEVYSAKPLNPTLHLIYNLDKALGGVFSTIDWIIKREVLVERLEEAGRGEYQIIRDLIKVLEDGSNCKLIVDSAIDSCEILLNIRNQILISRVNYAVTKDSNTLGYALNCLERYFSLIVFKHFIGRKSKSRVSFNSWLHNQRTEIWNMYSSIRKRRSEKLKIFRPIDDLSTLTQSYLAKPRISDSTGESIVVKNRSGIILSSNTILKSDHWQQPNPEDMNGAPNFRQIGNLPVFAVAQPTIDGIRQVLQRASINQTPLLWINMREEPLVYINGEPYVLRDRFATLRNTKVFSGISKERLEGMEETLKDEVLKESQMYERRIMVHDEVGDQLVATWECIMNVESTKMVFSSFEGVKYHRIPVTAEDAPDPVDLDLFVETLKSQKDSVVVINCQMGIGRSTIGTIISLLTMNLTKPVVLFEDVEMAVAFGLLNYEVINSLVRMLPCGIDCKEHLDHVVLLCSEKFDLIKTIHENDRELNACFEPVNTSKLSRKLTFSLKRYFLLLCFTQYQRENPNDTFVTWFDHHEEIGTLFKELGEGKLLEKISMPSSSRTPVGGNKLWKALKSRKGSVLAPLTILKFDHFPGCHRMSLPQRIEGAPNFRGIAIPTVRGQGRNIYGVAMPTADAIRMITEKLTSEGRELTWVCLREEPVIYVNGQPFVLRIVRDPNENVAMTGIDTERVELLEQRLLEDVLREAANNSNSIFLHEEGPDSSLVPMWEACESVQTMSNVFSKHKSVKYYRLPITDEQAPIPKVFDAISGLLEKSQDIIFNCQMGRGRTTTGMIVATIMTCIRFNQQFSSPLTSKSISSEDTTSSDKYIAGEYRVILQLTQILPKGRKSKQLTDHAIDICSHLQNLREAIYAYKQKLDQPLHSKEDEWEFFREQGVNYLLRYFYLICFTEFYTQKTKNNHLSSCFEDWLKERREIGNLVLTLLSKKGNEQLV